LFEKRFKERLNIVNIHHYNRKFREKSKVFSSAKRLPGKWVNIILLAALIVVIALIAISRLIGRPGISRHIDISISPQFENLFGADLAGALIKDFEKQRPDLRITKANEGADILFFDDREFGRLRSGSKLFALTPYIAAKTEAATEADIEQTVPGQDTQWALPLMSFMDLLFYNIDILQAANFDRPPKTRAEFLAAARAVANAGEGQDSVYSFALDLPQGARQIIYPWIWASGGEIYAGGETAEAPVLSRATVDTIAFFGQLQREGLLAPGQETGVQRLEEFAKGKIAMITSSARDIAFLQSRNINFGITAIPGTAQGKYRLGLSKIYAGISTDSVLPDEAWAFLSFLEGKSPVLAESLSAIPGSLPAAFPGEYILKNPLYSKAWDIFEAAEIVEYRSDPSDEETERLVMERLREQGIGSGD
jgi:multiple sugar transport system substrate-binding protein